MAGSGIQLAATSAGVLWDDFGSALAGRQVYVYKRDTTTQINIYQDEALTTLIPGGQPLSTQADGSIPGYAAGDVPFDFVDAITSKRRQGLEIGLQLWPSGGDDTTAIISAQSLGKPLGKGTFLISGAIPCPYGQGQALTTIQATAAAACIQAGSALPAAPTNAKQQAAGNFMFDGNSVATGGSTKIAVLLNTVNWRYDPIGVQNLPANVDALVVAGQNNVIDKPQTAATGTGFCLAFDNGAGNNTVRSPRLGGGNHIEFRETVGVWGYTFPETNKIDHPVLDQPNPGTYSIRVRAGFQNEITSLTQVHHGAPAISFEPMNLPAGVGGAVATNRRFILNGRTHLEGLNNTTLHAIDSSAYVSAGAATAFQGDTALIIAGELDVVNYLGVFNWGSTTPVLGLGADVLQRNIGTDGFWTSTGTGALLGAAGFGTPAEIATSYRELATGWEGTPTQIPSAAAAGTYLSTGVVVGSAGTARCAFWLDPADFQSIPGVNVNVRLRGLIITNAVAPATNYTFGLYPVATWGGASAATPTVATIGSAVVTTPSISTPAATTATETHSSVGILSNAGFYVIGCTLSGAQATNAVVVARAHLEMKWS